MIISHKHKFIFIKTHKTASSSVEVDLSSKCADTDVITTLDPVEKNHFPRNFKGYKNHMTIKKIKDELKNTKIFNSYFKFCVEREPVDKLLSYFYWKNRNSIFFEKEIDFVWESFIFKLYPNNWNLYHWTIDGELSVNKILRYENLKQELKETCKNLGFDLELTAKAKTSIRKDKVVLPIPNITNKQIEQIYKNWEISNRFTGYKIEDCKYYEN